MYMYMCVYIYIYIYIYMHRQGAPCGPPKWKCARRRRARRARIRLYRSARPRV